MNVIHNDNVCWEPLLIRVSFPAVTDSIEDEVRRFFESWMSYRTLNAICGCTNKHSCVSSGPRGVMIACQWMCETCLDAFVRDFGGLFGEAVDFEIGLTPRCGDAPRLTWIDRMETMVEFEDGRCEPVKPFSISKYPIFVWQFEEFTRQTGYITVAEANYDASTFRSHFGIEDMDDDSKANSPATCISLTDASAFCSWAHLRLPTEAEWIAALLVDRTIYDEVSDRDRLWDSNGRHIPALSPQAVSVSGPEWTGTVVGGGTSIVRTGPWFVRFKDWRSRESLHRLRWSVGAHDPLCGFRVVRPARA